MRPRSWAVDGIHDGAEWRAKPEWIRYCREGPWDDDQFYQAVLETAEEWEAADSADDE